MDDEPLDTNAIRQHFQELLGKAYIVKVVFRLCAEVDRLRAQVSLNESRQPRVTD